MNSISSINPLTASALTRLEGLQPKVGVGLAGGAGKAAPAEGFGQMLDGVVATVDAKQAVSRDMTKKVLLGETDQLHQSVIAMQEASVAFSMMIEVRNKLVESYQELMRMQV